MQHVLRVIVGIFPKAGQAHAVPGVENWHTALKKLHIILFLELLDEEEAAGKKKKKINGVQDEKEEENIRRK